jgi:hypothetical protein
MDSEAASDIRIQKRRLQLQLVHGPLTYAVTWTNGLLGFKCYASMSNLLLCLM